MAKTYLVTFVYIILSRFPIDDSLNGIFMLNPKYYTESTLFLLEALDKCESSIGCAFLSSY